MSGAGAGRGLLPLAGHAMHYAWGSRRAIPELMGAEPDGRPWAELWFGAHRSGPARVRVPGPGAAAEVGLDELLARDAVAILGPRVAGGFGAELPFLLKVLAAASPLSIQCHPDSSQARAGFEREERAGIPRDARERSYRDSNHKPELIVALTPFTALKGFRDPAAIEGAFEAFGAASLAPELGVLAGQDGLRRFFAGLMRLPEDRRRAALAEAAAGARASGADEARARWIEILLSAYPDDVGALAPLYLELVELRPGQALYLPARELHCYLEGTGLEIMAASDNVLRGGLTSKHVDVDELVRVLEFAPAAPAVLEPRLDDGLRVFDTPAREFVLGYADVVEGRPLERAPEGVEIVLVGEGEVAGGGVRLAAGRAALVPAGASYRLEGRGRVWVAGVP